MLRFATLGDMTSAPITPPSILTAEDNFSALMDAAVDAIVLIGERGDITRFNNSAERLFGYSSTEVLGKNISYLMPEPYRSGHDSYLQHYKNTGEKQIIGIGREVLAQRKDGSTFPIDLTVGEFRRGLEHGFVGILRDITERKRQEQQLRTYSEELRLIFENAPTAILITDLRGQILNANRSCCTLLGYSREELSRLRHSDLVYPDDRAKNVRELISLISNGESFSRELRYTRGDGVILYTLQYAAVARDDTQTPQVMICEIVDRSDLVEATRDANDLRERLTHVARLGTLGEMVSGIAHEVNQPLTAIANYANACRRLLLSGQAQPAELANTLEKISTQAERAGQVIRSLRALLRKRDTVREPLNCDQLVCEVARLTEFELLQLGFRLVLKLAGNLPQISGDGVQIQQVILNLIRNGMEAMQEKAQGDLIEVTTVAQSGFVEILISDSGPGLERSVADRLFEPFFTTKSQGIGLGLSICKSIISTHNGEIIFDKNARGGASVLLRLPIRES